MPPIWSVCACVSTTMSMRRSLRDQRYGATTCSPTSKLETTSAGPLRPIGPPASISMARPSGLTASRLSPWPTSMAVISSVPGVVTGRSGQSTSAAMRGTARAAAMAPNRERRTAQQHAPQPSNASSATHHTGAGTRTSAAARWLMRWIAAGDAVEQHSRQRGGDQREPRADDASTERWRPQPQPETQRAAARSRSRVIRR